MQNSELILCQKRLDNHQLSNRLENYLRQLRISTAVFPPETLVVMEKSCAAFKRRLKEHPTEDHPEIRSHCEDIRKIVIKMNRRIAERA